MRPLPCRTRRGEALGADAFVWAAGASGTGRTADFSFWPLPLELASEESVTLELRGDPAGVMMDRAVGVARLALADLAAQHPQLLNGEEVQLHVPLQPRLAPAASGGSAAAAAEGAIEEQEAADGDADSEGEDPGAASRTSRKRPLALPFGKGGGGAASKGTAAAAQDLAAAATAAAAAAGGRPTLSLAVRLESVSCLEAAVAAGVAPAAAQTCLAMLAEPGGIYLDVKSAYSTPQDLKVGLLSGY